MLRIAHGDIARGRQRVLHAGELAMPAGSTVGLVGLNGAGKSSWMMALANVLPAPSVRASATLAGVAVGRVAYTPQQPSFPRWLRIGQIIALYGLDTAALTRAFGDWGLDALLDARPDALSVGQRQLVSVAISLHAGAPLTLLDEPLASLDMRRRRQVLTAIAERAGRSAGAVTVLSAQVAADLYDACDWIVVISDGHYVFQGSRDALCASSPDGREGRDRFEHSVLYHLGHGASRSNGDTL